MSEHLEYPTLIESPEDSRSLVNPITRYTFRDRDTATNAIPVVLDAFSAETISGYALETLASEFFSDDQLWYQIADVTTIVKHPAEWAIADVVRVAPRTVKNKRLPTAGTPTNASPSLLATPATPGSPLPAGTVTVVAPFAGGPPAVGQGK